MAPPPVRRNPQDVESAAALKKALESRPVRRETVLKILSPKSVPKPWNLLSWLRDLEQKYNHAAHCYREFEGDRAVWVPDRPGAVCTESPLRQDLKKALPNDSKELIRQLEIATRTRPPSDQEVADKVLSAAQRAKAIEVAKKLPPKASRPRYDILAQWLFDSKVWVSLCKGGASSVRYTKGVLGGVLTAQLFRTPEPEEKSRWETGGAEKYLRAIAENLYQQFSYFAADIAGLRWTMDAGGRAGVVPQIRNFQKAWEELGNSTGTLRVIKEKLLVPLDPRSEFIPYLWSEDKRKTLPHWKDAGG